MGIKIMGFYVDRYTCSGLNEHCKHDNKANKIRGECLVLIFVYSYYFDSVSKGQNFVILLFV